VFNKDLSHKNLKIWERCRVMIKPLQHIGENWPVYALAIGGLALAASVFCIRGGLNYNYIEDHTRYLHENHELNLKLKHKRAKSLEDLPVLNDGRLS
jgi:hypothetical protein